MLVRNLHALLCGTLFILGVGTQSVLAETQEFSVGLLTPLSGKGASLGNYVRKGVELAYSQLPEEEKKYIKLFIEDDQWSVPRSVSAFKKLRSVEKIDAVITVGSAVGNAVAPLAEQQKLPMIAVGASDKKVVEGRTFSFTHWVTPETEAEEAVKEIKKRDYKRIGFITADQEGWLAVYKALRQAVEEARLKDRLLLDEIYLPEERDFRTYIAKARAKNLDAIVVGLFPGAIASFGKQLKQASLAAAMIGLETFEDENEVKASEGTLVGQWYVNADSYSDEYEALYRKKFKEYPGWATANATDAFNLLVAAWRKHGTNGEKIAEFLATQKSYRGYAGTYSSSGDNRFTLPATVKIVTEEGFEKLYK